MISTSSHNNCKTDKYQTYAISGNRGKNAGYTGKCYPKLAPKLSFWQIWENNIGVISEEENNKYYVEEYYNQVLSKLNPEEIYQELDNSILLCYEDNTQFCHRHIVAEWLEISLNTKVPEVIVKDDKIIEVDRPKYIKEYLEESIKKHTKESNVKTLAKILNKKRFIKK